jgi:hypothetical protein
MRGRCARSCDTRRPVPEEFDRRGRDVARRRAIAAARGQPDADDRDRVVHRLQVPYAAARYRTPRRQVVPSSRTAVARRPADSAVSDHELPHLRVDRCESAHVRREEVGERGPPQSLGGYGDARTTRRPEIRRVGDHTVEQLLVLMTIASLGVKRTPRPSAEGRGSSYRGTSPLRRRPSASRSRRWRRCRRPRRRTLRSGAPR